MTQEMLNLQWEKMSLYPAGHYVRRIRIKPSSGSHARSKTLPRPQASNCPLRENWMTNVCETGSAP